MTAALPHPATPARAAGSEATEGQRVGPNAVIQLGHVLRERLGDGPAEQVFAHADARPLLLDPPGEMVDERVVASLFRALHECLAPAEARAVAAAAGGRTADYLLEHRIPGFAHRLLHALPRRLSARLLLRAVAANAWTFAGSGAFRALTGTPCAAEIAANPLLMPDCTWHVAVFEGLFRSLVAPRTRVNHTACCLEGDRACRFEIDVEPGAAARSRRTGR